MIRIVSVVSTDLVVSSSWDDESVTVPTPHFSRDCKIVSILEVASSGSPETRAEILRVLAVEVETPLVAVPPSASLATPTRPSSIVFRPQCEQAQHLLSQSFTDWPAAVAEQLDDNLLMDIIQQGPFDGWDIQTTDAVTDAHRRYRS
jgi:hypothetical protein